MQCIRPGGVVPRGKGESRPRWPRALPGLRPGGMDLAALQYHAALMLPPPARAPERDIAR
jgi:hypothetical protein